MLADHLPHELAIDWYYTEPLLIAAIATLAAVLLIGGPGRPIRDRLLVGIAVGLAVILPTMTWGYCADPALLGLLALLLASPALVAVGHRVHPVLFGDVSFAVVAGVVLAAFVVGQSRGCWRDESYIDGNANAYVVLVAIPMIASWLCAWIWSHPTRTLAIPRRLTARPNAAALPDVPHNGPEPSAAQVQRAIWLARMSILPMVAGAILIVTVLLAPPGVVVFGAALLVRRGSRSVRTGQSQWSGRSVIGLAFTGLLTAGGGSWLLIWAIQEEFSFSSQWSPLLLWGALTWAVVYTVLIGRSLLDRKANSVVPN